MVRSHTVQVATQLFTAVYFVTVDSIMLLQWIYYNKLVKGRSTQ